MGSASDTRDSSVGISISLAFPFPDNFRAKYDGRLVSLDELLRERSRGVEMKLPDLEPEAEEGTELLVDDDATAGSFLDRIEPEREEELEPCLCKANEEVEGRKPEASEVGAYSGMMSWPGRLGRGGSSPAESADERQVMRCWRTVV